MTYINRKIEAELAELTAIFPVITITGPRQSGKTTLAKQYFKGLSYYNLENPDLRLIASSDPRSFLSRAPEGAILDEVQNVPELLSYIQQIVDDNRETVRYVLTGSNQFQMIEKVTQSLAGRTALIKLLPFSLEEIPSAMNATTDQMMYRGFYPQVQNSSVSPFRYYRNYVGTYVEKDLRQLVNVRDLSLFQRFLHLCAGRIGNLLNASAIASELGVSSKTVQAWISILETSNIIFLLQPYYSNLSKRLIKSPKIYFYDTGLVSYLLGIENENHIRNHPLRGSLFENLVMVESVKHRLNRGMDPGLYFYRDSNHAEIDLVFENAGNFIPVEIKSAQTFHPEFLKGFRHLEKVFGQRITKSFIAYDGAQDFMHENTAVLNFRHLVNKMFE